MEHKIIEKKQNPFFAREEVKIIGEFAKNPSFDEATELVAKEVKGDKEKIIVRGIKGKFGRNTFLIKAEIYANKEDRDKQAAKLVKKKKEAGK